MSSPTNAPTLQFPSHNGPRVWFLTSGTAPIAIALARQLLEHGDHVVSGLLSIEINSLSQNQDDNDRIEGIQELLREFGDVVERQDEEMEGRFRVVGLDIRMMAECQAAIATAVDVFGRVDILFCCTSETLIGTVEELSTSPQSLTLVRDQFETNFFGPVNVIKAALPTLRSQKSGHIIVLTGTTGHLGTPGLGMYCAANWAIEGFCDSLAYEIAPFNIKLSIIQPNLEISVLTNKLTSAPPLPAYSPTNNPAPLSREIIGNLVERLHESSSDPDTPHSEGTNYPKLSDPGVISLYPPLPVSFRETLLSETTHALTAIGGHENPPARHIVGHEAVTSVKEKLKTVSEELEDFVEISTAVDIERDGDGVTRRNEEE